jgi:3-deoxy-manno-octulosonate cytidylyltransferase (CMP-KDO synthetase)
MAGKVTDAARGTVIIVPARLGSTRLPGKPLADICGIPMIVRVMNGLTGARADMAAVATDSTEIASVVREAGFEALLTGEAANGTERVYSAWSRLGKPGSRVVNVQGDEPGVTPAWISALVGVPAAPDRVVTLARQASPGEEADPAAVKVVTGPSGEAEGFFRLMPEGHDGRFLVHIGAYCFSPESLEACMAAGTTPESRSQGLEQLAWLQNGIRIVVVEGDFRGLGVDTPGDLERAREACRRG